MGLTFVFLLALTARGPEPAAMLNDELKDEQFWEDPLAALNGEARKRVDAGDLKLEIAAPKTIDIDRHDSFPLVMLWTATLHDLAFTLPAEVGVVVATRLEDNQVFIGAADEVDLDRKRTVPDPARVPEGFSAAKLLVDLSTRLNLPAEPSTYVLTFLLRDTVSNRVQTKLVHGGSKYQDPAVAEFLESQRKLPRPTPPWPTRARPFPSYDKTPETPPPPAKPGIELKVDRIVVTRPDARALLRGSFRLPVLRREILPEPTFDGTTAILPITVLVWGVDDHVRAVHRLRVPTKDKIAPGAQDAVATGQFTIDLLALPQTKRTPQTYFVSAYNGEAMAGPTPMAFVAEYMLPR